MTTRPGFPDTDETRAARLTFGIYPGGTAGTETGLTSGPPDDPARINEWLGQLQGGSKRFLVRGYLHYFGGSSVGGRDVAPHPAKVDQYAREGRRVDLVLCFRDPGGDLTAWIEFVREGLLQYGPCLAKLQITEEPNLYHIPGSADGAMPNVREALRRGIVAAKEEACRLGLEIQIGFSAVPSFDPKDDFWTSLSQPDFLEALDYVGLDFFPDVFYPILKGESPCALRDAVRGVLTHFRQVNLAAAGIDSSTPIHVCENGWPTGPDRSCKRQADVIETTIRTVHGQATKLNLTHYELFSLRDADSSNPNLFHQFGLLRDDYSPKPAFDTYRRLIADLGTAA